MAEGASLVPDKAATPEELAALFGYIDGEWFPPRHNIAPTQPIAIVRQVEGAGGQVELVGRVVPTLGPRAVEQHQAHGLGERRAGDLHSAVVA